VRGAINFVARSPAVQVLGISLVTNNVVRDIDSAMEACHEEVLETGRMRSKTMQEWVVRIVANLPL
jgi:purine nucleoside phosphorylase